MKITVVQKKLIKLDTKKEKKSNKYYPLKKYIALQMMLRVVLDTCKFRPYMVDHDDVLMISLYMHTSTQSAQSFGSN